MLVNVRPVKRSLYYLRSYTSIRVGKIFCFAAVFYFCRGSAINSTRTVRNRDQHVFRCESAFRFVRVRRIGINFCVIGWGREFDVNVNYRAACVGDVIALARFFASIFR